MRLPRGDKPGLDLLGGRWTKCSRAWPPRSVRLASERLGWDSEARHAGAATDELELRERE
jgi:hypothetical protein